MTQLFGNKISICLKKVGGWGCGLEQAPLTTEQKVWIRHALLSEVGGTESKFNNAMHTYKTVSVFDMQIFQHAHHTIMLSNIHAVPRKIFPVTVYFTH